MSQARAAALLGMTRQAFNKRMTGERPFRAEELADLAESLRIPVSRFFAEVRA